MTDPGWHEGAVIYSLDVKTFNDSDGDGWGDLQGVIDRLPGTPVVLAGDEIGMGADLDVPERDAVRTPMQWSDERNAGFSAADPEDLYLPVVEEGPFGSGRINVADQRGDPDSLPSRIGRLVATRQRNTWVSDGEYTIVDSGHKDVFVHRVDAEDRVLACAHSFADEYRESAVGIGVPDAATGQVAGPGDYRVWGDGVTFSLDACDYVWLHGEKHGE
ncbi:MAG: hypothetical protein V5A28_04030 [Haloarculaceae archaeon]